jgi:capsular exopolysaccharide synthesis family protein
MNSSKDDYFFQEENDRIPFDLKKTLYKYLSYWKWFFISLTLALSFAFVYLKFQTPLFNIHSSILIKDEKKGLGQDDMLKQLDIFSSNKVVDNEIEILKSFSLMEKVVNTLNLNVSYGLKETTRTIELYDESPIFLNLIEGNERTFSAPLEIEIINSKNIKIDGVLYPANTQIKTVSGTFKISFTGKSPEIKSLLAIIQPISLITEDLQSNLTIEPSSKMSSVLNLNLNNAVPQKGKDILNKLVDAYNHDALDDKNKVAANTLAFIEERLKLISSELTVVEKSVENFKSSEGITDISAEATLFLESVKENDIQLNQVKIQQSVLGGIDEYVKNKGNKQGIVPATLGISDPTLVDLLKEVSVLEMQKERQIRLVKADNPIVLVLDDQIRSLKNNIYENVQSLKQNLNLTYIQLQNQNKRLESMIKTIPGKERMLVDISREQAIKNNLFTFLLQKREETALSFASAVSDSRTIDLARSGIAPFKPVERNVYLLLIIIGFAIPFTTIYIIDLLNDKIRVRKDIERVTKLPILGDITWSEHTGGIAINNTSHNVFSEHMRALRTNLSFLTIDGNPVKSILFTSSVSGEGKSFVSLNLGSSLAMLGKKVIILEFDLRKPKLISGLTMTVEKGLSSYLIGLATLDEIILPIDQQENYYIISSGPIPPNPVELLLNGKIDTLFKELRSRFDYIIVDAPPIGIVTDAQILEKQADTTLFVLRQDYTPIERVKFADNLDKQKRFKSINLVFNGVVESAKYGYGYGYRSGYGYGYYK